MPAERNSLIQSIRITGNGFTVRLRIERSRPQDLEEFLRENGLSNRIDFDVNIPTRLESDTTSVDATNPIRQLTAA
jgi:hypothetical protein